MAETTAQLNILIRLRDEASAAMRSVSNALSDVGNNLGFAGDKGGILSGAFAAIGANIIGKSVGAFEEANLKMTTAKKIFETLPDGMEKYQQAIEAGNDAQKKFGFDGEEVTLSIAKLARASGGDMTKAMTALQAAMGYSIDRLGGPDGLNGAVNAMLPVFAGGGRAAKALGYELDENASALTVFQTIANGTRPSLEAFGESARGLNEVLMESKSDIMEFMGTPWSNLKTNFLEMIGISGRLQEVIATLEPVWYGLSIAIGVVSAALSLRAIPLMVQTVAGFLGIAGAAGITGAAIAGFTLFILAWVAAITLVVAAGYLLWKNWGQLGEQLSAVWQFMKVGFKSNWDEIVREFGVAWQNIKNVFSSAIDWIMAKMQPFINAWNTVKGAAASVGNAIGGAVGGTLRAIGLAGGGIVTSPTFAMIGEAGPEAVVPLRDMPAFSGGGGANVTVQFIGDLYTTTEVAEKFGNEIARILKYQLKF